jgi:hypothetical protein
LAFSFEEYADKAAACRQKGRELEAAKPANSFSKWPPFPNSHAGY